VQPFYVRVSQKILLKKLTEFPFFYVAFGDS